MSEHYGHCLDPVGGFVVSHRSCAIAGHALGLIGIAITMALLADALQDALTYVPPYFRDKWGQDNILTALGQFVPPRSEP